MGEGMKKIIIALFLISLLAVSCMAQDEHDYVITKGFKFGLNISSISNAGLDMKGGLALGVFVNYPMSPSVAVQPELLYSEKGSEGGLFSFTEQDLTLTYLEIPILLKATLFNMGGLQPHLTVGPEVGILLSADYNGEDVKDDINSLDFGITFGAGFVYQFQNNHGLTCDMNFTKGMSTVFKDDDDDGVNGSLSFMVGYFF